MTNVRDLIIGNSNYDTTPTFLPIEPRRIVPQLKDSPTIELSNNNIRSNRVDTKLNINNVLNNSKANTKPASYSIFDTNKLFRFFQQDKSIERSLVLKLISQSKYRTNEIQSLSDWYNLSSIRQQQLQETIVKETLSGKNVQYQLTATQVIKESANVK